MSYWGIKPYMKYSPPGSGTYWQCEHCWCDPCYPCQGTMPPPLPPSAGGNKTGGRAVDASMKEYKPRRPANPGKVLLDRRRPFELFLKFGGGLFSFHLQVHRLVVMVEPRPGARSNPGARKK